MQLNYVDGHMPVSEIYPCYKIYCYKIITKAE